MTKVMMTRMGGMVVHDVVLEVVLGRVLGGIGQQMMHHHGIFEGMVGAGRGRHEQRGGMVHQHRRIHPEVGAHHQIIVVVVDAGNRKPGPDVVLVRCVVRGRRVQGVAILGARILVHPPSADVHFISGPKEGKRDLSAFHIQNTRRT